MSVVSVAQHTHTYQAMCKKTPTPSTIKEELLSLITTDKEIKTRLQYSMQEVAINTYTSQLPSAKELKALEQISPGVTGQLLEMMRRQQDHDITYDNTILDQEDKRLEILEGAVTEENRGNLRDQYIGIFTVIMVMIMAAWLTSRAQATEAVTLVLGSGALGAVLAHTSRRDNTEDGEDTV